METIDNARVKLPVINANAVDDFDIDAELAKFESEEARRLGLETGKEHWRDENPQEFTKAQREHTTILLGGLTMAQDYLISAALDGIGYKTKNLDVPDNDALRLGKEFGNRAQCNPTYFTVGNLVKYLIYLRDEKGVATKDIVDNYLFLTAGACGPCRFGMYSTEYRKALRDAGFDGFRVVLFQQTGGLKQATGEERGLDLNPKFFIRLLQATLCGDVINAIGYHIRPYEVIPGATDEALERSKKILHDAFSADRGLLGAMFRVRHEIARIDIDRTRVRPKVQIIGEFWAMTTEGDGNYELQRFLESEGAEADIQLVTNWILYMVWQAAYDTKERMYLRGDDTARQSLKDQANAYKKLATLWLAERAIKGVFYGFGKIMGLKGYPLPDMNGIAAVSHQFYNNNLRGGEGHMEIGKTISTVEHKKANMVLSVKPFGCMPSSGVSDGVASLICERYPETVFLPIETSGDGKVNVYSRVQMMLFKARQLAQKEFEAALEETGVTAEELEQAQRLPRFRDPRHYSKHIVASQAANFVYEAAPWIKRMRRWRRLGALPRKVLALAAR